MNHDLVRLVTMRAKQLRPDINIWNDNFEDTLSVVISNIKKIATSNDVLIEIHFDSSPTKTASGSTSLVSNNAREISRKIGAVLTKVVSQVMSITDRGVKTESQSNRGKLGILHTKASSVLLEIAFMSNQLDMFQYEKWKHWVAEEIAIVLIDIYDGKL